MPFVIKFSFIYITLKLLSLYVFQLSATKNFKKVPGTFFTQQAEQN
jgi:hypothetical protein